MTQRDRHCRFPGCRRVGTVQIDHVIPHGRPGGKTADANLGLLCAMHHRIKHQTHWSPVMHRDGAMTWRNPLLGLLLDTQPGCRGG